MFESGGKWSAHAHTFAINKFFYKNDFINFYKTSVESIITISNLTGRLLFWTTRKAILLENFCRR